MFSFPQKSPLMTPDSSRYYTCMCEISFSPFKKVDESTIVESSIAGLIDTGSIYKFEVNFYILILI
jgi:hypothetical protein